MKARLIFAIALILVVSGITVTATGQGGTRTVQPSAFSQIKFGAVSVVGVGDGPATLQYEDGTPDGRSGNTGGVIVGNQFDVGIFGGPLLVWTVSAFTVQNAGPAYPTAGTNATVVFFNGPGGGSTAQLLSAFAVPLTGGLQAFNILTPITGSGSFLGGIVNSTYGLCTQTITPPTTPCDGPAIDMATNAGLGFHAMQINAQSPTASGFTTIPSGNAIVRVTGTGLPVELMNFTVEDGSE